MNIKNLLVSVAFGFFSVAFAAGCSVPSGDGSEGDAVETSEATLKRGAHAPRAGYTCSGLKCTCTGDDDCNDMFSDGVCGDISSCDDTDPHNPVCECLVLFGTKKGGSVLRAPGGSLPVAR